MSNLGALQDEMQTETVEAVDVPSHRRRMPVEGVALLAIALGAVGQLIVKGALLVLAARHADPRIMTRLIEPGLGVFAGLSVYGIGTLFWLKAVSRAAISYLYPLSAGSYALVAIGGQWLFGETIHAGRWIGIAVITLGVAMLAGSQQEVRRDTADSIGG